MKTLNAGVVGEASVKKLLILLGKAHAYCIRRCGKWGSPSCFSCMFRDVRQLHREIERGTDDDRGRGGKQADAVQLVRAEDDEAREDSQPRGQVNTSHLQEALAPARVKATGLGLVGGDSLPKVVQESSPQRP